jgi:hypothetical protein
MNNLNLMKSKLTIFITKSKPDVLLSGFIRYTGHENQLNGGNTNYRKCTYH